MKRYEALTCSRTMQRLPIIVRLDGRAFHTFTAECHKPYDNDLIALMTSTTEAVCAEFGANIGYTQSDEISLVWLNDDEETETLFGGVIQKTASVIAATVSVIFLEKLLATGRSGLLPRVLFKRAVFDGRVFQVPDRREVINYLLWRERDATRNSLTMAALAHYKHSELSGKHSGDKHEMLRAKGVNWNNYPTHFKRGTYVLRREQQNVRSYTAEELEDLPPKHAARRTAEITVHRRSFKAQDMPPLAAIANPFEVFFEGLPPRAKSDPTQTAQE